MKADYKIQFSEPLRNYSLVEVKKIFTNYCTIVKKSPYSASLMRLKHHKITTDN